MSQQVKALAMNPNDPSLIPRTHTGEGENQLLQVVLISTCVKQASTHMHTHSRTHKVNEWINLILKNVNRILPLLLGDGVGAGDGVGQLQRCRELRRI